MFGCSYLPACVLAFVYEKGRYKKKGRERERQKEREREREREKERRNKEKEGCIVTVKVGKMDTP